MTSPEHSPGLERLLDAAERLFIQHGYAAVKLRHIAEQVGVRESSIYYHFPKGKEALFIAVMKRNMSRHREGIQDAIADSGMDWVAQLKAVGHWLVSQPPIDVMRMSTSDLPAIDPVSGYEIEEAIYEAVNAPVKRVLDQAVEGGSALIADSDLIAGVFVAMISSVHAIKHEWNPKSPFEMVDVIVESWVHGLAANQTK